MHFRVYYHSTLRIYIYIKGAGYNNYVLIIDLLSSHEPVEFVCSTTLWHYTCGFNGIQSSGTIYHLGLVYFGQLGQLDVVDGMLKGGAESGWPWIAIYWETMVVQDGQSVVGN